MRNSIIVSFLLLLVGTEASAGDSRIHRRLNPVKDRYIVVLEDSVKPRDVAMVASELGLAHKAKIQRVWSEAVKGFVIDMPEAAAEVLSHDPRIKFIEEDAVITPSAVIPTNVDPAIACDPAVTTCPTVTADRLWNLDRLEQDSPVLNNRFGYCTTGAGAYIYVMDGGVMAQHSEFWSSETDTSRPRVTAGYNATQDGFAADNPCGSFTSTFGGGAHGTAVASIAAGRKVGVAKGATIVPVKVISCSANGTVSTMTDGANWILKVPDAQNSYQGNPDAYYDTSVTPARVRLHHPSVATSSVFWVVNGFYPGDPTAFELALDALDSANVSVVASANNQNDDACHTFPGRHSRNNPDTSVRGHVITVGGTMIKNSPLSRPVSGSPYDPTQPTVDARWLCNQTDDDSICTAGNVPAVTDSHYPAYMGGSNWGPCVSLFAPSRNIPSASLAGEREYHTGLGMNPADRYASGTSYAAPEVAGLIARFISQMPEATPADVYVMLTNPANNGIWGILDPDTLGAGSPNLTVRTLDFTITNAPVSIGVDANGSAVLQVATTYAPSLSYEWYRVDQPSFVGPSQPHQRGWSSSTLIGTGSTLTVSPTQKTTYWARVLSQCCESDSNVATVYPRPATPQFMTATSSNDGTFVNVTWNSVADAEFYDVEREASSSVGFTWAGGSSTPSFSAAATPSTAYVFRVRASAGSGTPRPAYSGYTNNDLAVTVPFTDVPIMANSTVIHAQHLTELRKAVNAMCDLLNQSHLYTNTETAYASMYGQTVNASDFSSLRTNINTLRSNPAIGVGPFSFQDVLAPGVQIKKIHVDDLRASVQ